MDRSSSGDDGAFGALAVLIQDDLYRFALAHLMNAADAADAAQEALLRAYRGRRGWRKGGDAAAWFYGITMNVVREFWRKRRRREASGLDFDPGAASHRPSGPPRERTAKAGDLPLAGLDAQEKAAEVQRLTRAIANLPPRQREAVACRFLRQMSVRETAATMGCAEGTVKAAVFAAIEKLRTAMKNEEA